MKERIQELCKKNNISVNKLEDTLGFAKGYIYKLGKTNPSSQKLKQIADYFGVSIDYLMYGEEKDEKHYSKEVLEAADFLVQNDNLMALIECVKNDSDADLKRFLAILKAMKEK